MPRFKACIVAFGLILSASTLAATLEVRPGDSIQAAVDKANPGDTILIFPGTYQEAGRACPTDATHQCAVVVTKDDLRLVGLPGRGQPVVIENAGKQDQGIAVAKPGAVGSTCLNDPEQRLDGSTIEGVTVNNFEGEGVFLFCVDNFTVRGVEANGNGEYGIFPSHSGFGRVTESTATGSNDTGIYVGQSHDVRVDHNYAEGNVSGFEIENSSHVELDHNLATGDTGGILSFTLPRLDVNTNEDNVIHDNTVVANNKPNTCIPPDDVCNVPVGTGILLIATHRNQVRDNVVMGNDSFGILLADYCTATGTPSDRCFTLGIDPFPSDNRIAQNIVFRNGAHPDPNRLPEGFPGGDLLWTELGMGNCWERNMSRIDIPADLPACP